MYSGSGGSYDLDEPGEVRGAVALPLPGSLIPCDQRQAFARRRILGRYLPGEAALARETTPQKLNILASPWR